MKCNNCGKDNENGSVFCIECGSNLNANTTAAGFANSTVPSGNQGTSANNGNNAAPQQSTGVTPPVLHHYQSRPSQPDQPAYTHPTSYSPTPAPATAPMPANAYTVPPAYQPVYVPPVYGVPVQNVPMSGSGESGFRVIAHLKQLMKSPAMLVATIAFTISVVFYIMTVFGFTGFSDMIGRYGSSGDAEISARVNIVTWISGFLAFIPMLLTGIGLWMIVYQGFSSENRISTAGTTMIKGVKIFEFVMFCIGLTISFISIIAEDFFENLKYLPDEMVIVKVFAFFICIGYTVWMFFYYISLFKTLDSFRDTVLFRAPIGTPSIVVAVNCFLSSLVSIIAIVYLFVVSAAMDSNIFKYVVNHPIKDAWNFAIFSAIGMIICSMVSAISFGVMTVIYKNKHTYMKFER